MGKEGVVIRPMPYMVCNARKIYSMMRDGGPPAGWLGVKDFGEIIRLRLDKGYRFVPVTDVFRDGAITLGLFPV